MMVRTTPKMANRIAQAGCGRLFMLSPLVRVEVWDTGWGRLGHTIREYPATDSDWAWVQVRTLVTPF